MSGTALGQFSYRDIHHQHLSANIRANRSGQAVARMREVQDLLAYSAEWGIQTKPYHRLRGYQKSTLSSRISSVHMALADT